MPIADKLRPTSFNEMVGQEHLIGKEGILRKSFDYGKIPNMILFGPPGTGKTTVAHIASRITDKKYVKMNAVNCGIKDIKKAISDSKKEGCKGIILLIDEIQAFNKKQQQSLLEVIEDGYCTLVGCTADNPYFVCYKAVLSRCSVFEFKPISKTDVLKGLAKAIDKIRKEYDSFKIDTKSLEYIAETCNGDMRNALNRLELVIDVTTDKDSNKVKITVQDVINVSAVKLINYDRQGDYHYDILSSFHKSCRGSDADGALHYLARLIKSEDMQGITRRLLCVATEDIGMACPQAISIVNSCVQAAMQLGFPEAKYPLAHAVVYVCKCPKSDSVTRAIANAQYDVDNLDIGDIPLHLKDSHYSSAKKLGRGIDYKYPHNYENNYVNQQYLPDSIIDRVYYIPGNNSQEIAIDEYWQKIKHLACDK